MEELKLSKLGFKDWTKFAVTDLLGDNLDVCRNCDAKYDLATIKKFTGPTDWSYLLLCDQCISDPAAGIFISASSLKNIAICEENWNKMYLLKYKNIGYRTYYTQADLKTYLMKIHKIKSESRWIDLVLRLETTCESKKKILNDSLAIIAQIENETHLSSNLKKYLLFQIHNKKVDVQAVQQLTDEIKWLGLNGGTEVFDLLSTYPTSAERRYSDTVKFTIERYIDKHGDKAIADIPHSLYMMHKNTIDQYSLLKASKK